MTLPNRLYAGIDVGSQKNALCCLLTDGQRLNKPNIYPNTLP